MRRQGWFIVVGEWKGAPLRIHFHAPLFALAMPGRAPSPGTLLGFLLVVLVHELGHAVLVTRFGGVVRRIDVLPWGGECEHSGTSSELHDAMIAWGGVLAQVALMVVAQLLRSSGAPLHSAFALDVLWALTFGNFILAAFNLLPFRPFDGATAWRLVFLGPRWYLNRKTGLPSRFNRWRKRRRLQVIADDLKRPR